MNKPIISIIIPVFNAENYIEEALDSVVNQSFDDIEIIAVNDCSTDNSMDILQRYSEKHDKLRILSTDKNSGSPGIPKNVGIENAKGDYIMFMDNDDIYAIDACEILYDIAQKTDSDVIMGNAAHYPSKAPLVSWKRVFKGTRTNLDIRKNRELILVMTNWAKLFKQTFLIEHNIRFHHFNYFDDQLFMTQCYYKANHVSLTSKIVYFWRDRAFYNDKSLSQTKISYNNLNHIIEMNYLVDQFYEENKLQLYRRNKDIRTLNHSLNIFLKNVIHGDVEYQEYFFDIMSRYLKSITIPYEKIPDPRDRFRYYCLQKELKEEFFHSFKVERGLTLNQLPRKYVNNTEYINFLGNDFESSAIPLYLTETRFNAQVLASVEDYTSDEDYINITGYSFVRFFDVQEDKDIEKALILSDNQNNSVYSQKTRNTLRKDRTIVFQKDCTNYDYSGFNFSLNIEDVIQYIKKDRQYKLQIYQKYYGKREYIKEVIFRSWVNRDRVLFFSKRTDGSIFCLYSSSNRELVIIHFSSEIIFKLFSKKPSIERSKINKHTIKSILKKLHLFNVTKKIYQRFIK